MPYVLVALGALLVLLSMGGAAWGLFLWALRRCLPVDLGEVREDE